MKRGKSFGHSARRGNASSPYSKYDKKPYDYSHDGTRLASGELKVKANDKLTNRYG